MKKIMLMSTVFLMAAPSFGADREFIICTNDNDKSETIIELNSYTKFNKSLNCIKGYFVGDLTACAPNDGYGLSSPTGSPELVGVVSRWQDYMSHNGGIAGSIISNSHITFLGGRINSDGYYESDWRFEINRLTGKAKLEKGKANSLYSCKKAKPVL